MITRVVPSLTGTSDPGGSTDGRVKAPEDVLRQARAKSITGVLGQLASVASYALEILQELNDETVKVHDRMAKLHQRVDVLTDIVDDQLQQHNGRNSQADLLHLLPSQEESDCVLCIQAASSSLSFGTSNSTSRPATVVKAYERCEGIPPLELLDSFYDAEQRNSGANDHGSISRKKYSNPGFFMEEWLKNEESRHQRALELKEERRRERRDAQNLRKEKGLDQERQTTSSDDTKSSSTDDTEQKMKFLKIRSWREIYGTGEGKELMRQQQSNTRSPSLRDLRKKAHQSLAAITQSPTRVEERQQAVCPPPPPPPPPPLPVSPNESTHTRHQSLSSEQFSAMSPPDPPTSLGGAFMQEMDDDEIAMEMQFVNGIPPPPPPPDSTSPEEFTDHGLSYYYDPAAIHNLTPPPPPPPELDELSKSDAYYDAEEGEEDENAIPPPPAEEFIPPPPPEPPRPSTFLEEFQLGASLRSVKPRPPPQDVSRPLNPQNALLQQILLKQSRHLRPVEPRRPALQSRPSTGAPFADSIARILERRSVIAYDSDSDSRHSAEEDW